MRGKSAVGRNAEVAVVEAEIFLAGLARRASAATDPGIDGDAGAGLKALQGALDRSDALIERYRNPRPRLEAGQRLAPLVRDLCLSSSVPRGRSSNR